MKAIAYYLPQFHRIPENDKWWGQGFTEWTNVRSAQPLFNGHRQPRVPLDGNYISLDRPESIRWQAELARKYRIDGFCLYHYWFEGKLLLEKPAEIILANHSIDIDFCFSWANETWSRTWTGKDTDVLIKQTYGGEREWKEHFLYLVQFFLDDRYIKVDGRPMLLVYKSESVPRIDDMLAFWDDKAREYGLPGMHFVETVRTGSYDDRTSRYSAFAEFEPARSINSVGSIELFAKRIRRLSVNTINSALGTKLLANRIWSYDSIVNKSLGFENRHNTYGCVFVGWDNSPRKGERAFIITEPSRKQFSEYLKSKMQLIQKYNDESNQFVFVNAWNEWAEGTYLEPDTCNQYMYLEVIREQLEEIVK